MKLVPKRNCKRLTFFGVAGSVLIFQTIADINELPQKDYDHDKTQDKADDRGIKRGSAPWTDPGWEGRVTEKR